MSNKSSKTVTTLSHKQSTRSVTTSMTVSKSQTTSSGFVNSYGSPAVADRAFVPGSSSKTYEPVYEKTRQLSRNTNTGSHTPKYQVPTQSATQSKDSNTAGGMFYSFQLTVDKKRSTSLENDVPALTVPNLGLTIAAAAPKIVTQDAQPSNARSNTPVSPGPVTLSLEKYDLRKPAYVLIFHNIFKNDKKFHRKGSEHDLKLIKEFVKGYNMKIADICEDFSVTKVKKKMNKVSLKNFGSYSSLMIVIMSHGGLNDQIQASNGFYHLDTTIVEPTLMNETLKGKPKLFFVQACKGDAVMEADATQTATNKFDILKCFSTYEGTLSFRDTTEGTTFIQTLFKLIEQNSDKEIIDIMRLMRNIFCINKIAQAPTETSTLTKKFYFNDLKK
ncbi:AAEL005963-PA [Aedes aegypti]|uniref:AAEL005963-PA n=1 Tax=Aedes aegypti TaxID=7159 RepID=Q178B6_AEDAE|nr:AAEL005963-PA [Aedes aegypti]